MMIKERGSNLVELESLSSDMFSPLSEREASLVIGGTDVAVASYTLKSVTINFNDAGEPTSATATYQLTDLTIYFDV